MTTAKEQNAVPLCAKAYPRQAGTAESMKIVPRKLSLVIASASFLTAHTWKPQRRRASDSTCRTCRSKNIVRAGFTRADWLKEE